MFGTDSTKWTVLISTFSGSSTIDYHFEKDTLINGIAYKKITSNAFNFLFREDLNLGKVWYRQIGCDTSDFEYMNYALQKGDTFNILSLATDTLEIVDTTYISNNRKHIRFKLYNYGVKEHLEFIEGIGTNYGLEYKTNCTAGYGDVYLMCAYQNGVQVFSNKLYNGNCYPSNIEKLARTNDVLIYPNPATNYLTFTGDQKVLGYYIVNTLGQKLLYRVIAGYANDQINISSLPAGIYTISIITPSGILNKQFTKL